MKITSSAFTEGSMLPKKYTCQGENMRPPFEISDPPENTRGFAIIVHDHDAESKDFVHWIIWNINPAVRKLEKNTTPVGAREGINDAGKVGWSGPCPPSGKHRYEFHLYALHSTIDLPATSDKTTIREKIQEYLLEEAAILAVYDKSA